MTLRPIPGAPFGASIPAFPGSETPAESPPEPHPEPPASPSATGAVYWENQHFGLWLVPNPIPCDTMDTLLQFNWRNRFNGRGTSFTLLINRADLTDALSKAKLFWSRWQPGINMVSSTGMFVVLGDPDYDYSIEVHTTGGIYAKTRDDTRGVELRLRRDSIPHVSMETKRKADANTNTAFTLTRSELERLCDKLGIG